MIRKKYSRMKYLLPLPLPLVSLLMTGNNHQYNIKFKGKERSPMENKKYFEPIGYAVAVGTFFFSLLIFYRDNAAFLGSLAAALMAAGLVWATYIVIRIFILALNSRS